ncbi:MarR family winged helix-turn-helix transcriptional regulator [Acetobacterium woodii]|uniref:Transcriptional regulator MarR family n=1 Tax=Acetobacterium woodii (strain ATCC 29683 / DSM 1030 / JCM 2381 / KCTC 1655 / WB1) TaxID=931626 RepID=H6LH45_ACEWD|nr:MarR family transcriptional regulator [Acetobacterium woodii]AFA47183.1 transcriptional regulator MarR family [Acetobacterium woodii DSM 1030]
MGIETLHFIMINNKIFRNNQIHLDKALKKFDLSSGLMPYLFILEKNEGVSLHQLSTKIGNDKAMTTRTIKRLIELDYVYKIGKEGDCRAYQLYLTKKSKAVMPQILKEIQMIVDLITVDLSAEEKKITMAALKKISMRTQQLRDEEEVYGKNV